MTVKHLPRGKAVDAKREMAKIFSWKRHAKLNMAGDGKYQRRRVMKTALLKVSGTQAQALLDSGAITNVLLKALTDFRGTEPGKRNSRITAVTGKNSPVIGILNNVLIQIGDRKVKLSFLVVKGLSMSSLEIQL